MRLDRVKRWCTVVALAVLLPAGALRLWESAATGQNSSKTGEPFLNAESQRALMIEELRKTNQLLAEQNALLRSGKLKVVVDVAGSSAASQR